MKSQAQGELVELMNDLRAKMAATAALASAGCDAPEAGRYQRRLAEVLERIDKARDHLLAAKVDAEP